MNASVKLASLSCSTNFARVPASSQVHKQVPCLLHDPGLGRVPSGAEHRDAAGAMLDCGQDVDLRAVEEIGGEKSSARIPCACDRRNSGQPGPSQRGGGSIPALLRICHTVDAPTVKPSPASSPRISASFHHDARRDSLSSDTARETIRKISFKPTSRQSSHPPPGRHRLPAQVPDAAPSRRREKYICPGGISFRHVQASRNYQLTADGLSTALFITRLTRRVVIPALADITTAGPPPGSPLRQAGRACNTAIADLASQASLGIQPRSVTKRRSRQAPVVTRNPA